MCKKVSGAPVASWMDFHIEQLTWNKRKPLEYQSSENVQRGFCPTCGSSLSFRDTEHPEENNLLINRFIEKNDELQLDSQKQILPQLDHHGDGFYAAVISYK